MAAGSSASVSRRRPDAAWKRAAWRVMWASRPEPRLSEYLKARNPAKARKAYEEGLKTFPGSMAIREKLDAME